MLFYITGGAPQAVPGTACVEANQTACTQVCCSSESAVLESKAIRIGLGDMDGTINFTRMEHRREMEGRRDQPNYMHAVDAFLEAPNTQENQRRCSLVRRGRSAAQGRTVSDLM
jgi:hypothetical protein